jgi:LacI family transcriptional regulator
MELGYHPSAIARGLSGKKMNTVGAVFYSDPAVPLSANPYFNLLLDGIFMICTREHQNTMFCALSSWDAADEAIHRICDGRCDGVLLLVPPANCEIIARLQRREFPFVALAANPPHPGVSFVDVDNVLGARQAAQHLIHLGHRRINFVMERRDRSFQFAAERLEGARQALEEAGLALNDRDIVTMTEAYTRTRARGGGERPTAFLCLHDLYAMRMLDLLRNVGIRVPEDVSVVGFDDIYGSASTSPPLTTIRQNAVMLACAATEILLEQICSGRIESRREIYPPELIVRQSSAPPRAV